MTWFTQICLPLAAAIISFGIGLGVTVERVRTTAHTPALLLAALVSQVVVLPLVAVAASVLTGATASLTLGMLVLAAAPSNVSAPLLTRLARGDVAFSLAFTVLSCLLSGLTIPL